MLPSHPMTRFTKFRNIVHIFIFAVLIYQSFIEDVSYILKSLFSKSYVISPMLNRTHRLFCMWFKQLVAWVLHDDVIKWEHFPRYWPFVWRIHRSPVNSPHKGQWRGALMFSLICVWLNGWVNNREAGDLNRYRVHYVVSVMFRNHHGIR